MDNFVIPAKMIKKLEGQMVQFLKIADNTICISNSQNIIST